MKKVVLMITAAVFTTVFFSCKDATPEKITNNPVTEVSNTSGDLALVNTSEIETENNPTYLYVTASSGLSLREFGNLQSEKLARMPYGTRVKVISAEKNPTMNIGGIVGGMNEIAFNHKKGFAFNGYLSKYFPPEADISAKGYATELKELFPEVLYAETVGGTASKPTNTETITLSNAQWHEVFFMAQRLFDFPKEFSFPNPKGKDNEVVKDKMPKKDVWTSELHIQRKDNSLEKIEYVYRGKGFGSTVTIVKDGDHMKLSKTEFVE